MKSAQRHRDRSQIPHARNLARTLGTYRAARFLAKRGWSLETALWVLAKSERSHPNPYDR